MRDKDGSQGESGAAAAHGGALAAFVTRDNRGNRTDIERHYRAAVRSARERVLIANAYFFPGYRLLRDLRRAARRGVQVDLILQDQLDMPWAQRASKLLYRYLMRAGVRVYEYSERPLHAKVAVVDDRWATVGSSNLDPTSLSLNLEANVVVRDETFARHLRERIEHLMQQRCERVRLPTPGPLPEAWMLPGAGLRAIGLAMVAVALAYVAMCRFSRRRTLKLRGHTLTLPSGGLATLQMSAGGANWLLIGAIVWGLLGGRIDYPTVLGVMLLGAVAGVVTHVPANLGVLEAVVVYALGAHLPAHELLAAVLAYRAAYYLLPLALALPAYGLSEAAARRADIGA